MYRLKQVRPTKTIVICIVLAVLILTGCVGPRGWPGIDSQGDTLFVGTMDGRILALDVENLTRFWPWEPEEEAQLSPFNCVGAGGGGQFGAGMIYGPPTAVDDVIYVGAYNGKVYAIDMDGLDVWDYDVGSPMVGGVAISGNALFVGASDGWLRAIDIETGEPRQGFTAFKAGDKIWSAPLVVDGTVYFGSMDHNLYALDETTGDLKWKFETKGGIASLPRIEGGVIYIGSFDNRIYAVNANTGEPEWSEPFEAESWFWSRAEYRDGILYACSMDHHVYAIEAAGGQLVWSFDAGDQIKSSPVIVGDVLVVAAGNGKIYGLDLTTGEEEWPDYVDVEATVIAPLFSHGDKVYVSAQDNRLYVIEGATGQQVRDIGLVD